MNERRCQYDTRPALLVNGLESRACLSTILAFAYSHEDAQVLAKRLCKKGQAFVEKDDAKMLKSLCVPKSEIKKKESEKSPTLPCKRIWGV